MADDCDDTNADINPDAAEIAGNGIDEDCDGMDMPSSTQELNGTTITIFPVPVHDILNIEIAEANTYQYHLINGQGQMMEQGILDNRINLSAYAAGNYYLRISERDSKASVNFRFVKMN